MEFREPNSVGAAPEPESAMNNFLKILHTVFVKGPLGALLALLGLLALTQGAATFVVVVTLYVLYMTLENHVISPAIIGHAVDISPPTTMLAALIGGAAAGVPGALVATPLVGAVKQIYMQLRWGQQPFVSDRPRLRDRVKRLFRRHV